MDTPQTESPATEKPPAAPPPKGSALRLAVLLGLLLLVLGALAYDQFVAKPHVEAADKALDEYVKNINAMPVTADGGGIVGQQEVKKFFGWGPTWVKSDDAAGYTIEYYCYWGYMPYLSRQRQFIAVVYTGKSRRYAAHYPFEPPASELPAAFKATPKADETAEGKKEDAKDKMPTKDEKPSPAKEGSADKALPPAEAAPADTGKAAEKDK
jgi:hypothetical protein